MNQTGNAGLRSFVTETFNYKNIVTKAAAYTVLTSDDVVQVNGAYTMTLPALNSLGATITKKKAYKFTNIHATSDGTIAPGTDTVTGVANTINGKASYTLRPNESIVITGAEADTDWAIVSPLPVPALTRVPITAVKATSSTATQYVFSSSDGAPANIDVDEIVINCLDTTAANITIKNGASVMCTISKATTNAIGTMIGAGTISYAAVAKGTNLTVVSSATNGDARVSIIGTMQTLA